MEKAKTSFRGSRRWSLDSGFSLFGTLCVILVLSALGLSVTTMIQLKHDFVLRRADKFYAQLEQENLRLSQSLRAAGFGETGHEAD
ncbi:MAG: hypothetical protein IJP62_03190 [Treponema sp.]|nr:hypothetical protein [Treponema sp.]